MEVVEKQKLLNALHQKVLMVSVDMEYSKSKILNAKYNAYAEIWNEIKLGKYDIEKV